VVRLWVTSQWRSRFLIHTRYQCTIATD
jgi:hypothetical protein